MEVTTQPEGRSPKHVSSQSSDLRMNLKPFTSAHTNIECIHFQKLYQHHALLNHPNIVIMSYYKFGYNFENWDKSACYIVCSTFLFWQYKGYSYHQYLPATQMYLYTFLLRKQKWYGKKYTTRSVNGTDSSQPSVQTKGLR